MTNSNKVAIHSRSLVEVNTDPQRRCYNGGHIKSELRWTSWALLEPVAEERVSERLKFWRELNDYAISQRGESARLNFCG
jgi:hypothetical protein